MRTKHLDRTKQFYVSDVKSEKNYISVLHNIVLALGAYFALFLCSLHRTARHKLVKRDNFGTNKAALKIGVYFTCRLGSLGTFLYCPRSDLGFACGEIRYESEQAV